MGEAEEKEELCLKVGEEEEEELHRTVGEEEEEGELHLKAGEEEEEELFPDAFTDSSIAFQFRRARAS